MMKACRLCPRNCGVNREIGQTGYCHADAVVRVARAALHMWEEPCISGKEGSGAVFFTGCNLGCVYCQNYQISGGEQGKPVTTCELSDIFLNLQAQHANNINLVTAGHYLPQVAQALRIAKEKGLVIPVVYNSSGYEKVESLRMLEGLVDIYLPDYKYAQDTVAAQYSHAKDYPVIVREAIREMVRQVGEPEFDERGIMKKGVIVRHLLLPGHVKNAKMVVKDLYETYRDQIYISLMNQYTPMPSLRIRGKEDEVLLRKVTKREYERLLEYAMEIGVVNGFLQEGDVAKESFIPAFDGEGVP